MSTSDQASSRYAKQALFAPIGAAGQAALGSRRALICGCGATGGMLAELLTRAGVGSLRIVDRDFVELSNLQRQVLFDEQDAAEQTPKAIAAAARLRRINSEVTIEPIVADVAPENVLSLVADCDLILDGTDNFETRFLLNDVSLETGTPWIYCGVIGGHGQTMAILPGQSACLRCLMDTPPDPGAMETCDTAGVIGPAVSAVASLTVANALKLLIGHPELVPPRLHVFDVWDGHLRSIDTGPLRANGGCAACGDGERAWLSGTSGSRTAVLCGRNAVQVTPGPGAEVNLSQLASRLSAAGPTKLTPYLVRHQVSEPYYEITIFRDGRAIIQGTEDLSVARSVYARIIGS